MTQIPLHIHEQAIERYRARTPQGELLKDNELDRMAGAMLAARTAAEQLAAVSEAVANDQTMTPGTKALRLRESAMKLGQKTATKLDQAREATLIELEVLGVKMLPASPANAQELQLRAEVRARLAAMDTKARGEAITHAINSGDTTTTGAIFAAGVPAYLVNMSEGELLSRRGVWQQANFPKEFDRANRLKKALEAMERGATSFLQLIEAAANSPEAMATEAAAQASQMALAAAE